MFKRTGKQFIADDCMGLGQQVAFSSLFAFLPTVILLIGLLGLFGDRRLRLARAVRWLGRAARRARRDRPGQAGRRAEQERLRDRVRDRPVPRALGVDRRDGRADQGSQPRLRPDRDAAFLEAAADRARARGRDRARARRGVPADRLRRRPRRRDRPAHRPRRQLQAVLEHRPLADRLRRGAALQRARLLPRAERAAAQLALDDAGLTRGRARLARALGPVRALHLVLELVHERPTARSPARSSCCSGSTTAPGRSSSARS